MAKSSPINPQTKKGNGWLLWYVIGNVFAPFSELSDLAEKVGFPDEYVPKIENKKSHARGAWEKGISNTITSSGYIIRPTDKQAAHGMATEGVVPYMKMRQVKITGTGDKLVRQLVLEVTRAIEKGGTTQKAARKQLAYLRTHKLDFDVEKSEFTHMTLPQEPQDEIWVNGNVDRALQAVERNIRKYFTCADPLQIRRGLYDWLDVHGAFNARSLNSKTGQAGGSTGGGGGVYYIPDDSEGRGEKALAALVDYIDGLSDWLPGKERTKINIVPVSFSGDRFAMRRAEELMGQALEDAKKRANEIAKRLAKVRAGTTTGKPALKAAQTARAELIQLKQRIAMWQESMGMDFDLTKMVVEMAEGAVSDAEQTAADSLVKE